ncbi:MAG: ABC transporter ATP-binding protein [Coriobacteriia bacterium]|nr:ABC transporter ATP-binding protein [Coriobacteriia bacterium]
MNATQTARDVAPAQGARGHAQTLSATGLTTGYETRTIIKDMDIRIPDGKISVIIGGNGCGKSTLLKTLARLLKPSAGQVLIDGQAIATIPTKKVAQRLGLLPQSSLVPDGIRVSDLVARGRFPYQSFMKGLQREDYEAVHEAMELMGILELMDRPVDALSGGQRQRVWIAMALAQQTDILLLDEPTTYLDIAYQVEILDLLCDLNRQRGTTIAMVLHDINLSARYADYMFALKQGTLLYEGTPREVVTAETMRVIFDLDCAVIDDPVSGTPLIVPRGRHHRVDA